MAKVTEDDGWVLRGPGVFDLAKLEIEFSVVSVRGESQLLDAFHWIKKFCS